MKWGWDGRREHQASQGNLQERARDQPCRAGGAGGGSCAGGRSRAGLGSGNVGLRIERNGTLIEVRARLNDQAESCKGGEAARGGRRNKIMFAQHTQMTQPERLGSMNATILSRSLERSEQGGRRPGRGEMGMGWKKGASGQSG